MELTRQTKEYFDDKFTEVLGFLSERVAHKEDLEDFATKADLTSEVVSLRAEMNERFQEMNIKLDFMRSDIEAIKKDLASLVNRIREDDDALSSEIVKLKIRVEYLEKQLKRLSVQQAS